jgi:hypothetical protein
MMKEEETEMKPTSNRRQMTSREADEGMADLINRGFITVVRTRRDGSRVVNWTPEVSEWWEAAAVYCMARDDDALTEAHRKRARQAWLAIKDQVELDCDQQALVDEVMRFQ